MSFVIREKEYGGPSGQDPPAGGIPANSDGGLNRDETQVIGDHGSPESMLEAQQEYFTVTARDKKNVRRSTMLLASLFILGLLCLLFMIRATSPQKAAASSGQVNTEEAQIEKAIAQLIGVRSEMFNRMGEIVKKFYEFSDVHQVKVDELAKNPFKLEVFLGELGIFDSDRESLINAEIARQGQLRQRARDMQLLSIVATDMGYCCVIDDKRLYEGDSIKGFNVRRIGDRTVVLESEGVEVILKLTE